MKYRVYLAVSLFLFFTISLRVYLGLTYFIHAQLQDDIDVVRVLKDTVKLDDVLMMQSFVDFDLGEKLIQVDFTFCLALFF
jgi:hypothetical protein